MEEKVIQRALDRLGMDREDIDPAFEFVLDMAYAWKERAQESGECVLAARVIDRLEILRDDVYALCGM